jgi:hypothetical protein
MDQNPKFNKGKGTDKGKTRKNFFLKGIRVKIKANLFLKRINHNLGTDQMKISKPPVKE